MQFVHLTIMVKNLEASIEFYTMMTELKIARRFYAGLGEIAFLTNADGETEIELVAMPEGQKFEGKGLTVCFETDKLDAMHQMAEEKGLNPSDMRNPNPKSRYFYVYDHDRVSVEIKQIL